MDKQPSVFEKMKPAHVKILQELGVNDSPWGVIYNDADEERIGSRDCFLMVFTAGKYKTLEDLGIDRINKYTKAFFEFVKIAKSMEPTINQFADFIELNLWTDEDFSALEDELIAEVEKQIKEKEKKARP